MINDHVNELMHILASEDPSDLDPFISTVCADLCDATDIVTLLALTAMHDQCYADTSIIYPNVTQQAVVIAMLELEYTLGDVVPEIPANDE